jgi:hypothetical protein
LTISDGWRGICSDESDNRGRGENHGDKLARDGTATQDGRPVRPFFRREVAGDEINGPAPAPLTDKHQYDRESDEAQ